MIISQLTLLLFGCLVLQVIKTLGRLSQLRNGLFQIKKINHQIILKNGLF